MRAVDTNVLVRLVVRDDDKQLQLATDYVNKGVWVSHLVLVETAWVLSQVYRRNASEVAAALEMLLTHPQVTLQDPEVVRAALDHYRQRPSLRFSDCMILEIARKAGHTPLGTFDKSLSSLDGAERL